MSMITSIIDITSAILPKVGGKAGAAVVAAAAVSLCTWYLTAEYKNGVWSAKLKEVELSSSNYHNAQIEQALAAAAAIRAELEAERMRSDEIQRGYDEQIKENQRYANDNRALADKLGGLRDPGKRLPSATRACDAEAEAADGTARAAEAARLSVEASEFLLKLAEDADESATYASSCYKWIKSL